MYMGDAVRPPNPEILNLPLPRQMSAEDTRAMCACVWPRPKLHGFARLSSPFFVAFLPQIPCCFLAVVAVAEGLQIAPVGKHRPVALVVADVVHVRGPCAYACPGALCAPWLAQ